MISTPASASGSVQEILGRVMRAARAANGVPARRNSESTASRSGESAVTQEKRGRRNKPTISAPGIQMVICNNEKASLAKP